MPSISVVIPAYNAEQWIRDTLRSVLSQTSPAEEVVVVDDGSTDRTAAVARGFGDAVRVVSQPNEGAPAAYNRGFAEARGEYVAMCSADDLWDERKLEWQRAALVTHPEVDIVFGGARTFGLDERECPCPPIAPGVVSGEQLGPLLYRENTIAAPTAVVRRELHTRLGRFREDLPAEDYEFWMRAARAGATFLFDPRVVLHLRLHGGNLSAQALRMWSMNLEVHRVYGDVVDPVVRKHAIATDLRAIGRCRLGLDRPDALDAYRASLQEQFHPAALAFVLALRLPGARGLIRWVNAMRSRKA